MNEDETRERAEQVWGDALAASCFGQNIDKPIAVIAAALAEKDREIAGWKARARKNDNQVRSYSVTRENRKRDEEDQLTVVVREEER